MEMMAQIFTVASSCSLLSIPFLTIPNIWSAFSTNWDDIFRELYIQPYHQVSFLCGKSLDFITVYGKLGLVFFWPVKSSPFCGNSRWSTKIVTPCWWKRQNSVKFFKNFEKDLSKALVCCSTQCCNTPCFQEPSCWVTWAPSQAQNQCLAT